MGAFDIAKLDSIDPLWVRIGLDDMEVEIRHQGPRDQERWRQKMAARKILKRSKDGTPEIAKGQEEAFFRAYAEEFITDWRNVILSGQENPPYDVAVMGKILGQSSGALTAVMEAIGDESGFFSRNGSA